MAQVPFKKCNTCNENIGRLFCYECKKFLCESCRKFHDKFTKDHCVKDSKLVDNVVLNAEVTCKQHSQEYSYYCEGCSCLICDKCALDEHKKHGICRVDEKSTITRDNLRTISAEADLKTEKVMKKIKELESYKNDVIPKRKSTQKAAVKEISKDLIDIIESVTQRSLEDIENTFEAEVDRVGCTLYELGSKKESYQRVKNEAMQKLAIEHNATFLAIQQKENILLEDVPFDELSDGEENFDKAQFVRQCIDKVEAKYLNRLKLAISGREHNSDDTDKEIKTDPWKALQNECTVKETKSCPWETLETENIVKETKSCPWETLETDDTVKETKSSPWKGVHRNGQGKAKNTKFNAWKALKTDDTVKETKYCPWETLESDDTVKETKSSPWKGVHRYGQGKTKNTKFNSWKSLEIDDKDKPSDDTDKKN